MLAISEGGNLVAGYLAGRLFLTKNGSAALTSCGATEFLKGRAVKGRHRRNPRRQLCAPRWRRLVAEQFEPRQMLANSAPSGMDATITTLESTAYVLKVADFGFKDSGDATPNQFFSVRIASLPPLGQVTNDNLPVTGGQFVAIGDITTGKLKFTPPVKANGLAFTSFTFQVEDDGGTAGGGSDLDPQPKLLTIDVTPLTPSPKAIDDSYYQAGEYDNAFFMATPGVLLNDIDPDGLPLTATLVRNAQRGPVTFNPDGSFLYKPNYSTYWSPGMPDSFTYRVSNGKTMSAEATVTIGSYCWQWFCTNGPASDDAYITAPNSQLVVGAPGVLSNDNYAPLLKGTLLTGPSQGTLSFGNDGSFSYKPKQDFVGKDTFSYAASNGEFSTAIGFALIIVTNNSRTPQGFDGGVNASEDKNYVFKPTDFVAANSAGSEPAGLVGVQIIELPYDGSVVNGNLAIVAGQTIPIADIRAGKLQYIPQANESNSYFYSYYDTWQLNELTFRVIDDGGVAGGSHLAATSNSLKIHLTPVNDPPTGFDGNVTTQKDLPYRFDPNDFRLSDSIDLPANGFAAAKIVTLPAVGRLMDKGIPVAVGQVITKTEMSAGQFQYIPDPSRSGFPATSFSFQVQDDGGTSFGDINLDPTAKKMTINVAEGDYLPGGTDKALTIVQQDSVSVYSFSPDDFGFQTPAGIPPATLTAVKITSLPPSSLGHLEKTHYQNAYYTTYVVAGELIPVAAIEAGELKFVTSTSGSRLTSFTFQVQTIYGTDPTPNTMTISSCSDCRQPVFDKYILNEDGSLNVAAPGILANDRNNPTGLLPIVIAGPYYGTIDFKPDGSFRYTPKPDYAGYDRIFYRAPATDGDVKWVNSVTEAEFYVTGVNDPPEGKDSTVTTLEDTPYVLKVTDFVTKTTDWTITYPRDVPNNLLAVKITTLPLLGTLTLNSAAVHVGDFITAADITAGTLRYLSPSNKSGSQLTSFTFQVQDNGGTANGGVDLDPTPNTITINVTPVNDAPRAGDNSVNVAISGTWIFGTNDFGFSDADDNPLPDVFAGVLIVNSTSGLTLSNSPVSDGAFVTAAQLDNGQLRYTAAAIAGQASFNFQVRDAGAINNLSVAHIFSISIIPIPNNPPTGANKTLFVQEISPYNFAPSDFGFSDPFDESLNQGNQFSAVIITTLPFEGTLLLNGVTPVTAGQRLVLPEISQLSYKPFVSGNCGGSSIASFSFQVQDNGGTTNGGVDTDPSPNTIAISILAEYLPSFGIGTDKSGTDESGPLTFFHWAALSVCAEYGSGEGLHFVIQSNSSPNLFLAGPSVDDFGTLTFTPAPNAHGVAEIALVLFDAFTGNNVRSAQTFHITISKPHRLFNTAQTGPRRGLDVTGFITSAPDGFITPGDALAVINYLNAKGAGPVPASSPFGPPYCDTDGDGLVIPSDALKIINYLNTNPGQSEGESSATNQSEATNLPSALISLLAFDIAEQSTRRRRIQ